MTSSQAAVIPYRHELDGLRAIAVMAVILYHAGIPGITGGYVGVDIFFVISGFLITAIIDREIKEKRFGLLGFYDRRVRRILPALFFVCAACLVPAWWLMSPDELDSFGLSLAATAAFTANLHFYANSGYFTPDIHTLPLVHMWSLAVEEQFYLLFPIALAVMSRWGRTMRNAVVAIGLAAVFAYSVSHQDSWPLGNFYLAPLRAWELLAGALLALERTFVERRLLAHAPLASALSWLGLALILAPVALYNDRTPFPGWAAVPPVLGTLFVIVGTTHVGAVRKLLSTAPLVGLGLISYSAYLWHQPLFAFWQLWRGIPPSRPVAVCLIGVTLSLAWLSWRWIERPFRNGSRFSRRQIFAMGAVSSVLLIATGLGLHMSRGAPQRFDATTLALASTMQFSPSRTRCHTEGIPYRSPSEACRHYGRDTRWAVIGDSHGIELGQAMAERMRSRDEAVAQLTFSGCFTSMGITSINPGCSQWRREAMAWIIAQKDIRNVAMVNRHNVYLFGDQARSYPALPDEHPPIAGDLDKVDARIAYWRSLRREVQTLTAAGKMVFLFTPVPEPPAHVRRFLFSPGLAGDGGGFDARWVRSRNAQANAELRAIARLPGVRLIDTSAALCDARQCRWRVRDRMTYLDDNHLSMTGARLVIDRAVANGMLR